MRDGKRPSTAQRAGSKTVSAMSFSVLQRAASLVRLQQDQFDVLVIGGGITGAGIALDAASRGLKVALVEQHDFAYGTSSRSTKLIHGGLRYLKQLEFALVKEVGSERAIVHGLAPHLVVPEKMLLPLYESRGLGYWLTSVGLKIYDLLAGVKAEDQRRMLTRQQTLLQEPLLKPEEIKGGALYAEYRTDDARLTIEICKRACQEGAMLVNYVEVVDFLLEENRVAGVKAENKETGDTLNIRAKAVVNAAGPWVDLLRERNRSKEGKYLHLTKGVHVVVPYHRLPVRQAIYFDVPDGRMIFAIPRGRITYIGTTDTDYKGSPEDVSVSLGDVRYLVSAVNETFPSAHLTPADVESSWAGLRPLIHEDGKSASELSRKDEIFESPTGLISIAGGKLTGYRKMAERVVDRIVESREEEDSPECRTQSILLAASEFSDLEDLRKYGVSVDRFTEDLGLKGGVGAYLIHLYGQQATGILQDAAKRTHPDPEVNLSIAELTFAVENECVVHADDFLVRRTGWLYFDIHRLVRMKEIVLAELAAVLGWSQDQLAEERSRTEMLVRNARVFDKEDHRP
jgi:glycerol-3-phosphate dehydrogenase